MFILTFYSSGFVKSLFEGTFRSVLVCQECGNKRSQSETFMSISLPLSKEIHRASLGVSGVSSSPRRLKLSVERCLLHFTMSETLSDPVDCPSCGKKTLTKKQHVISKLPRVLCLHLKRFDAALNKKIEEFVSFPENGLNMGPFLPHWCEESRMPKTPSTQKKTHRQLDDSGFTPEIMYDLFGTVNHFGSMQSGHYTANVQVRNKWYHCNDAHVSHHSSKGVLEGDGAYLLFYIRRG